MTEPCVFLLSPASCAGRRTAILLSERAEFPLARQLRGSGAAIGEVFAFLSGLYFRGKLAYTHAFGRRSDALPAGLVITTSRGLVLPSTSVVPDDLREFGSVDLDPAEPRYREPLLRDARSLNDRMEGRGQLVLLGSIATGKYVDLLLGVFGRRLVFPADFVGRGDMSRGSLMLRAAESGTELDYIPADGAVRRGSKPPRLEPRRWTSTPRSQD